MSQFINFHSVYNGRILLKETRKKLNADEIKTEDFYNFTNLKQLSTNVKQDSQKNNISWRKLKWIKIDKNKPFVIKFIHMFSEIHCEHEQPFQHSNQKVGQMQ